MSPAQVNSFLSMINRRCEGVTHLVDRILQGARLDAGRELPVRPEPVEVAGVLRQMSEEFGRASTAHPIKLSAPEGVWVNADPEAVDQVMGLLIENAIKYSPEGGEIRVEARPREREVVFRVADHGVGLTDLEREHIFEPYFKAARGDANRFGGVGLGLSITRHLVNRHGGDIWVTSKPNEGSVFSFTLPRVDAPEPAERTGSGDGERPAARRVQRRAPAKRNGGGRSGAAARTRIPPGAKVPAAGRRTKADPHRAARVAARRKVTS